MSTNKASARPEVVYLRVVLAVPLRASVPLVNTSRSKLLNPFADPDSNDAVSIGYVTTSSV